MKKFIIAQGFLVIALLALWACTPENSECSNDEDCSNSEYCATGGGAFVSGGVCLPLGDGPTDPEDDPDGGVDPEIDAGPDLDATPTDTPPATDTDPDLDVTDDTHTSTDPEIDVSPDPDPDVTPDAGPEDDVEPDTDIPECTEDDHCDDGISCTVGSCSEESCQFDADDTLCDAADDGECIPELDGCQYPTCDENTCTPNSGCEEATCDGNNCVRTSLCASNEECCAGECVPVGCDDGVDCTDNFCDNNDGCIAEPDDDFCDDGNQCTDNICNVEKGCEAIDNDDPCDDGLFCTGDDSYCSGGSCSDHQDDPCPGTNCLESSQECDDCSADSDCGTIIEGSWSDCGDFSDTCSESGTRTREIQIPVCDGGECTMETDQESESCTRDTSGVSCGDGVVDGEWGDCEYSDQCANIGQRERTITTYTCSGGSCSSDTSTETDSCSRNVDGSSCGDTSYGTWGDCQCSGTCGTTGTRQRTNTVAVCHNSSCSQSTETEEESCSCDTEGDSCGEGTVYGDWSDCEYDDECTNSGERTRSVTTYECTSGSCSGDTTTETDSSGCSRNTSGDTCGDGVVTGDWSDCEYDNECTNSGERTRSVTTYECSSGSCSGDTTTETDGCSRNTDGDPCIDTVQCNASYECEGGSCVQQTAPCPDGQVCCNNIQCCSDCLNCGITP